MAKKILVTGATGLAGAEVVRQAIADPEIESIVALVRRPPRIQHPKLTVVLHDNFKDYGAVASLFREVDACLWCLGISQTQVKQDEYIRITYEYAVTAAQAMLNANPAIALLFLSGMGADPLEKSRTLFARIKGKTENNLKRLPFKSLWIVRPGGIIPTVPKENPAFFEKLLLPLFPILKLIMPGSMISSADLAKAMLDVVKNGSDKIIIENPELLKRAAAKTG